MTARLAHVYITSTLRSLLDFQGHGLLAPPSRWSLHGHISSPPFLLLALLREGRLPPPFLTGRSLLHPQMQVRLRLSLLLPLPLLHSYPLSLPSMLPLEAGSREQYHLRRRALRRLRASLSMWTPQLARRSNPTTPILPSALPISARTCS